MNYANHNGDRSAKTAHSVPFNPELLFSFPMPRASTVFGQWNGEIVEPEKKYARRPFPFNQPSDRDLPQSRARPSATRAKTHKENSLDKRVDRFRGVMLGKSPMTSQQTGGKLPPTSRTKFSLSTSRDSARSSLSRLVKSGHVKRVVNGNEVRFKWIGA